MSDIRFVCAEKLENLEDYATSLLTGIASLKTLGAYHVKAVDSGLLDQDEEEMANSILWELKRVLHMYKTQMQNVLERTSINEDQIIAEFKKISPEFASLYDTLTPAPAG